MKPPVTLFPDANIFLHYKQLKDIDWCGLAGAAHVQIVVCLQVIKELDAKKSHPLLADRATRAIREIRSFKGQTAEIRPLVTLRVYNEEIHLDALPPHMSPDSSDDRIVYQAKQYAAAHMDEDVMIVTEDLGMELRCDASGIRALALHPDDRLPDPQSELSKKNQHLTKEIDRLTSRIPRLTLSTDRGTGSPGEPFTIELKKPLPLDPATETDKERSANPPLLRTVSEVEQLRASMNLNAIPPSEYVRYNKELEEYLAEYAEFVRKRSVYLEARARSFLFKLILENTGTTPAEDIDVFLRMAADVVESLTEEDENDLPVPKRPKFPEAPKSPLARMMPDPYSFNAHFPPSLIRPPVKHDGLQWVRITSNDNQFRLRAKIAHLKHGLSISIGEFRMRFRSWESVRTIQASCSITAGNHPSEIEQMLLFRASVQL